MRTLIVFLFLCMFPFKGYLQGYDCVNLNVFQYVFPIRYENNIATCFTIEEKGTSYLVTAGHLFGDKTSINKLIVIEVYQDHTWKKLTGTLFKHFYQEIDIAIIKPFFEKDIVNGLKIDGIYTMLGSQVFFLGYPFGISTSFDTENIKISLPLIKSALVSGFIRENNTEFLLLDGMNNPGFSGGPVVSKNYFDKKDTTWHVIGVISGYVTQKNQTNTKNGIIDWEENSGIIKAVLPSFILQILNDHETK